MRITTACRPRAMSWRGRFALAAFCVLVGTMIVLGVTEFDALRRASQSITRVGEGR